MSPRPVALLCAVFASAAFAQEPATPAAPPPIRDPRRISVRVEAGRVEVRVQADAPGEPRPPALRVGGRALRLRAVGGSAWSGASPGRELRYEAKLPPSRGEWRLELVEADPGAAWLFAVAAPWCVLRGEAGRLLADRDGVQAVGELFPAGRPVVFTLAPASGACAAPELPPPPESGRRNAHLSHTPRHDGVFFMAADGSHHLEMTCACRRLTLYLYDDRVIPLPATGCAARIEGLPGGARPLAFAPDGETLGLPLPEGTKPPLNVTLRAALDSGLPEERFDFHFPFCDPCPS